MVNVTAQAARQIREAAIQSGAEGSGLRIAAKREPDGSVAYAMGFDEEREGDLQVMSEGLIVLVSPHSEDLLEGVTLDFVELEPGQFNFIFINPNDTGCGPELSGGGCSGCSGGGCST